MDWYVVKYLFPNSMNKFSKIMFPNTGLPCLSILVYYDIKKLYSFFDKMGIFLTVEMHTKDCWLFTISLDNGTILCPCQISKKTREDIEIEGFYECFRILEKKLENIY